MNAKVTLGLRILFGIFCLIFGLNKFLGFMPPFEFGTDEAAELFNIYASSKFLLIIGGIQVLSGIALLLGKFVPMALIFMVAIMFNALLFHLLHDPANIVPAIVGLTLSLVLVYAYKPRFLSIMSA